MKEIEVTISPEGETTLDAKGFKGKECLAATQPYEQALGIDPDKDGQRVMKPEARQVAGEATRERQRNA